MPFWFAPRYPICTSVKMERRKGRVSGLRHFYCVHLVVRLAIIWAAKGWINTGCGEGLIYVNFSPFFVHQEKGAESTSSGAFEWRRIIQGPFQATLNTQWAGTADLKGQYKDVSPAFLRCHLQHITLSLSRRLIWIKQILKAKPLSFQISSINLQVR